MIIKKYDIELHRLTEADLELVRRHRNSDAIREKMIFQKEISAEDQKKWFLTINNAFNYYFLVNWKGKKVGLINGTITSLEKKETKGGVFFWDNEFMLSYMPICASLIMGDLTFFLLKMLESKAVVRTDNERALTYNLKLGYKTTKIENEKTFMTLDKKSFNNCEFKKTIKRIRKDDTDLSWHNIHMSYKQLENRDGLLMSEFLEQYKSSVL